MKIKSDSNKQIPKCPIDRTELKKDRINSSLHCGVCGRQYYANLDYDNKQRDSFEEYDDLETESSINNQGALLISSSHEFSDFNLKSSSEARERERDPSLKAIKKYFADKNDVVTITSYET